MLRLAQFNFKSDPSVVLKSACADSLALDGRLPAPPWLRDGQFDLVLTNPPFGVSVNRESANFDGYLTARDVNGEALRAQGSEIMFVEKALRLLKPGGRLGIVLPRSVVTNKKLSFQRAALGRLGYVLACFTLPPETFNATGAQTTTVVLIIEKYGASSQDDHVSPVFARIDNVGYDTTGRAREGNQLPGLGDDIAEAVRSGKSRGLATVQPSILAGSSFERLESLLSGARSSGTRGTRTLDDLISFVSTGTTPSRASYTDNGLFLIKVGNLTGSGINWIARDRNFVDGKAAEKYRRSGRLARAGDILLTSSAHNSKYIGKKVDIVTEIPDEVGGEAAYVGEVMLLRPRPEVDPFLLLAYMRSRHVSEALQDRVRGQTAHLHADDLRTVTVDADCFSSPLLKQVADLLREEAEVNQQLNSIAFQEIRLRAELEKARLLQIAAE